MSEADKTAKIAAFFTGDAPYGAELAALRALLQETTLEETWKWRSPVYCHAGGNVCALWRLRDHCGLSFFKGALLDDPEGRLTPPGPNSRAVRVARFTERAQVEAAAPRLRLFLAAAQRLEAEGERVPMNGALPVLPEELAEAFEADPDLAEAFQGLTPGRQRGWLLHVSGARQAATRRSRIAKAAPRIRQGKGLHDR